MARCVPPGTSAGRARFMGTGGGSQRLVGSADRSPGGPESQPGLGATGNFKRNRPRGSAASDVGKSGAIARGCGAPPCFQRALQGEHWLATFAVYYYTKAGVTK